MTGSLTTTPETTLAPYSPVMFSPALGRAVRATSALPAASAKSLGCVSAAQQNLTPAPRPTQQRRYSGSSTKPSALANGANRSRSEGEAPGSKAAGKASKKTVAAPPPNVPRVASTDHLDRTRKEGFVRRGLD